MKVVKRALSYAVVITSFCFSLGTSAQTISGPYLPPDGQQLLIIGQDVNSINNYNQSVGVTPAGVTNYINIASLEGLTTDVDNGAGLNNLGRLFQAYPDSVLQIGIYMVGSLGNVNSGQLDGNLDQLVSTLKSWERPIFLRWGYEFDGPWNGYDPDQYKASFIRMKNKIDAAGADNIVMVWQSASYCNVGSGQITFNNLPISSWWPGDQYVDWIALSYFRPDDCNNAAINNLVNYAREKRKPLMIAESTPQRYDIGARTFSNSIGANDALNTNETAIWNNWFAPYFGFIEQNKDIIKAVSYINADWDNQALWGPPYASGYWGDSRVQASSLILNNWKSEISNSKWLHASSDLFSKLGNNDSGGNQQTAFKAHSIPGLISAEDYDNGGREVAYNDFGLGNNGQAYRNDDVDLQTTSDQGGGVNVGWTQNGEWLEYTIGSVTAGTYDINFRIAANGTSGGKSMRVELDGTNLGTVTFSGTGGWQTWSTATLSNISVSSGTNRVLRVNIGGGGFNLNWLEFSTSSGTTDNGVTPPSAATRIQTKQSNTNDKCLDVSGRSNDNGANIVQYSCHNNANQKWIFTPSSAGFYEIKAVHSNACLDVSGPSTNDGANVHQWSCSGASNQRFSLNDVGQGWFTLKALHSDKCIGIANASSQNGGNLQQQSCNNASNQHFRFN